MTCPPSPQHPLQQQLEALEVVLVVHQLHQRWR